MLKRAPTFGAQRLIDKRDSEVLAAEAEARGEVRTSLGAERKYRRYLRLQHEQIRRELSDLHLPEPDEVLFFVSQKDVNTFTLLLWILEHAARLDELFVTTFNVNQDIIRAFAGLLDSGEVGKLSLVLSQSIESRMPDRVDELRQAWEARQDRMRVSMCWNHSKIALADTGAEKYVLTGSGNYSFNAEIEQYAIWNDADLFDWLREVLEDRCFVQRTRKSQKVWGVNG